MCSLAFPLWLRSYPASRSHIREGAPHDASNATGAEATGDAIPAWRHAMTEERLLFVAISVVLAGVVLFLAIKYLAL